MTIERKKKNDLNSNRGYNYPAPWLNYGYIGAAYSASFCFKIEKLYVTNYFRFVKFWDKGGLVLPS